VSTGYPTTIDVAELDRMRRDGTPHLVVDVREPWELEVCALGDSLHLPLGELPVRWRELPRDQPVVVICHHGVRSLQATAWLHRNGHDKAINLTGGIDSWAIEIDPCMRRY
jgi:rhodanese-related sulfurtransferase